MNGSPALPNATRCEMTRAHYARNAQSLREMLVAAGRKEAMDGKKYCGFTSAELRERVATHERVANMTDSELMAWQQSLRVAVYKKLQESAR